MQFAGTFPKLFEKKQSCFETPKFLNLPPLNCTLFWPNNRFFQGQKKYDILWEKPKRQKRNLFPVFTSA